LADASHPVNLSQQVEGVPRGVRNERLGQVLELALLGLPEPVADDIGEGSGLASGGQAGGCRRRPGGYFFLGVSLASLRRQIF
jgi:hypothetical protein